MKRFYISAEIAKREWALFFVFKRKTDIVFLSRIIEAENIEEAKRIFREQMFEEYPLHDEVNIYSVWEQFGLNGEDL